MISARRDVRLDPAVPGADDPAVLSANDSAVLGMDATATLGPPVSPAAAATLGAEDGTDPIARGGLRHSLFAFLYRRTYLLTFPTPARAKCR